MNIIDVFISDLLLMFGLPIVFLLVFSKGLLIGKFIPGVTVISTYIIINGNLNFEYILFITLFTALSTTTGELIIFSQSKNPSELISRYLPDKVNNILDSNTESKYFAKISNTFSNNIGATVFIANITPGLRGLYSIPAGKNQYSTRKFFIISYISTLLYHTILTYIFVKGLAKVLF